MSRVLPDMPTSTAKVWVIQADDLPFRIHRESKPLAYDAGDDTRAMLRSLNGGSLARRWDYWTSSLVINRLKCQIVGCLHEGIPIRPGDHPRRHVTWAKIRLVSDFMRDHPEVGWKDLFQELVEDEFKATVARLCFGVPADSTASPPLDLQALLDP